MRTTTCLALTLAAASCILQARRADAQLTAVGSQLWGQGSPGIDGSPEASDAFGEALAVGDFDCDGFDDLAVGMPHEDIDIGNDTYANAGAVQVLYGGPTGTADSGRDEIITQEAAMAETLPDADYSETGDHFGWAVAAYESPDCGPRLAVGAPDEDSFGHIDTGKVFLFKYSQTSGHFEYLRAVTQDQIGGAFEEEDSDQFGYAIAGVDLRSAVECPPGLGASRGLAIGAPGEGVDALASDQGAVYVIRSGFCTTAGGTANWEFEIDDCVDLRDVHCLIFTQEHFGHDPENGDRFGETLSARATDRLIVGSPGEDDGEGIVQVYNDGGPSQNITQSSLAHGASEVGDNFGVTLAEGDFDGDGELDLAIGVPGENVNSNSVTDGGAVAVVYAPLLSAGDDYFDQDVSDDTSPEDFDQFGSSLAAGDFNGDGIDDLAIGAPGEDAGSTVDAGAFHVLYGDVTGLLTTGNQTFTQNSANVPSSAEECDGLGMALAAGNFDDANGADLAAGVPGEDGVCNTLPPSPLPFPDNNEGAINVLYSSVGGFLSQISAAFSPSPVGEGDGTATVTFTRTGSSVAAASVAFTTLSDTATENADFTGISGSVNWPAGDAADKQVQLPVLEDPNDEPSESLILKLLLPSSGAHIVDDLIPLTILDNDLFTFFADGFETSATGAWTSSFASGNSFTRSNAARYAGGSGLVLGIGTNSAIYLQDEMPFSSTYHARFYLRLLPLTMGNGESFPILTATDPAGDDVFKLHVIRLGTARVLRAIAYTDTGSTVGGALVPVPPGRRAIEISWQRGAAGQMTLKVDGQLEDTITNVANNGLRVDRVRFGAPEGFDSGTTGSFSLDEFASAASFNLNQVSAFLDVDKNTDPLWNYVHSMYNFEVTNGCQAGIALPLNFCGRDAVTREELALLLVRAQDGPGALPPSACGAVPFDDVASGNSFCRYVKAVEDRGISTGCGGGNYCPKNPVRRGDLAVLLIRAIDGGGVTPAPCATKPFNDIETTDLRCPFIKEVKDLGISNGCGGGNYCPDQPVRRQELAILMQRAFGYRLPILP